jgi:hypothetical protein
MALAMVVAWAGSSTSWFDRLSPSAPAVAYTTDDVNVRLAPSLDGEILDVAAEGTEVTLRGRTTDGFRAVEFEGIDAWISVDYLAFTEPSRSSSFPRPDDAAAAPADEAMAPSGSEPVEPAPVMPGGDNARPEHPVEPEAMPSGERWIDVNRTTKTVTLFIGSEPQQSFIGKLGRDPSPDGFYATAVGTYHVFTMHAGLTSTPFVEDVYMTAFVGFDPERHNGFHSPIKDATGAINPWQNPTTLGCVRLDEDAAQAVYAFAEIGMRVEVHD